MRALARSLQRPTLTIAGLALVLGGAAACGSDDPSSAPDDASQDDFCQVYADTAEEESDDLDTARDAVEQLIEVGTPEDMPEKARDGFETLATLVQEADDNDDLEKMGEDLDQAQQENFGAFIQYITETCADELGIPSDEDLEQQLDDLEVPEGLESPGAE
ncbi:hypothetical protein I601_1373 [Nocardioides dokdonensis FR1436]|uniref:Uncharacterized protein n=1 Tax=Nocardioides dokdonensis FR1436 TaxID=1300347 RepID=A0A1A9GJG6_9ACTN|nr:hypothetical protein [Nocardioides dokdonensis]ANH37812.1 hypothetical protein I601_1373 [Nocardioides dokdonensis FR1436]